MSFFADWAKRAYLGANAGFSHNYGLALQNRPAQMCLCCNPGVALRKESIGLWTPYGGLPQVENRLKEGINCCFL